MKEIMVGCSLIVAKNCHVRVFHIVSFANLSKVLPIETRKNSCWRRDDPKQVSRDKTTLRSQFNDIAILRLPDHI